MATYRYRRPLLILVHNVSNRYEKPTCCSRARESCCSLLSWYLFSKITSSQLLLVFDGTTVDSSVAYAVFSNNPNLSSPLTCILLSLLLEWCFCDDTTALLAANTKLCRNGSQLQLNGCSNMTARR